MELLSALKNPPKKYRPLPFWSWNDRLDCEETRRQVALMDEAGLGGFFMHARGGLQTPYMEEEWMDNIRAACDEAAPRGMYAWGYDENGWPSGFGDGAVNGLGVAYQQKYLRCCEGEQAPCPPQQVIGTAVADGKTYTLYYDINPFYVDTMDREVTDTFLRMIHETYRAELGDSFGGMTGFFTDEPQVSRNGIPWSLKLPQAYRDRYGEDILPLLPQLFHAVGQYPRTRSRFWALVRDLFCDNFLQPLYEWCDSHGLLLTGHLVLEETMEVQLTCNSACAPGYEHLHIPGMDWLGRGQVTPLTVLQVSSTAQQTGKKQVLSETFAMCGWDVDFEEMRRLYESQMVRGVNLLCQHLEGYSLRGIRKRDYPASLSFQQPWWEEYARFNDLVSRIGYLLTEGTAECRTLLLHPQATAWTEFDNGENGRLCEFDGHLAALIDELEGEQIPFHLGDERILQRYGRSDGAVLHVGKMSYSTVLVPPSRTYSRHTLELLQAFRAAGGRLVFCGEVPTMVDGVCDDAFVQLAQDSLKAGSVAWDDLLATDARPYRVLFEDAACPPLSTSRRLDDDRRMVYVVNRTAAPMDVTVLTQGRSAAQLCESTGELLPVSYAPQADGIAVGCSLPANGSAVLLISRQATWDSLPEDTSVARKSLPLPTTWQVAAVSDNTLVLDHCDCYVDGELLEKNIPVIDLQDKLCAYRRAVDVAMDFRFCIRELTFTRLQLVLETPSIFEITLNGHAVPFADSGFFRDPTFRTTDLLPYVHEGENHLRLTCRFVQKERTYVNIENSYKFESELNKLSYDMEIEVPYLVGDFAVFSQGAFQPDMAGIVRSAGPFELAAQPQTVTTGGLCTQGFPFFGGSIRLSGRVDIDDPTVPYSLDLARLGATAVRIRVNGEWAGTLCWAPYTQPLDGLLRQGENTIVIELLTSLRNVMGPFHQPTETFWVAPGSFFRHSPLWGGAGDKWNPAYLFAEHGIFPKE